MNMDLLSAGLRMMVLGMGMVYVFLIIMIFAMKLMSKALKPFANALQGEVKPAAKKSAGPSDEQLAAVAAAVVAHKLGK